MTWSKFGAVRRLNDYLASSSRPLLLEGELAIVDREGFVGLRV